MVEWRGTRLLPPPPLAVAGSGVWWVLTCFEYLCAWRHGIQVFAVETSWLHWQGWLGAGVLVALQGICRG